MNKPDPFSPHHRKLLIGGVGLVKGRINDSGSIMLEICDELEALLDDMDYTKNAPFETVSLIFRFGERIETTPEYQAIDKRYKELPVAIELDMAMLRKMKREQLKNELLNATILVLVHIAKKYNLPYEDLIKLKDKSDR